MVRSVPAVPLERFTAQLFDLFEETFDRQQGIYLDKGTSLFETLEGVSAEEASRAISATRSSIAAHVDHLRFYMDVLQRSMRGEELGKIDWKASWTTQTVTPKEWEALKGRLRERYNDIVAMLKGFDAWDGPEDIAGSMAIVVHTAYHLGAIRQILGAVKA